MLFLALNLIHFSWMSSNQPRIVVSFLAIASRSLWGGQPTRFNDASISASDTSGYSGYLWISSRMSFCTHFGSFAACLWSWLLLSPLESGPRQQQPPLLCGGDGFTKWSLDFLWLYLCSNKLIVYQTYPIESTAPHSRYCWLRGAFVFYKVWLLKMIKILFFA